MATSSDPRPRISGGESGGMNDIATPTWHIEGDGPPLVPPLAEVMPAAPELIDRLASEFAPTAATLTTDQAYWVAFNGWITDRLSGPILDGEVTTEEIGAQAWTIYATGYWGALELREHWGMPPALDRLGLQRPEHPYPEVQQGVAALIAQRLAAVRAGDAERLASLPAMLREAAPTGLIYGMAYNAGVQVVKTEDPPIGQRRPHRPARPSIVRINTRDLLRVDYERPTPDYLRVWRAAFERAVTADPDAYEQLIGGADGDTDLREIWRAGVVLGNTTWGGDAQDQWSEAYWEETIRWSSILNFGLEAAGLAACTAALTGDAEAARRALLANTLYLGASIGWLIGFLDTGATMPRVVEVRDDER
jgi:hypothetical protein